MNMRKAILAVLLLVAINGFCQEQHNDNDHTSHAPAPQVSNERNSPPDFAADLQRMRILLGQMQRNVAFVSAGDTPLKHQFELELQMWQLLIQDMEKKAAVKSSQ